MTDRYLSPGAKAQEMAEWSKTQSNSPTYGPGIPDPEIVPWCDRINEIPGVCTLQSCAGHMNNTIGTHSDGHLWLWLSGDKARAFYERAFRLAKNAAIERVSTIYQSWGQEIVNVEFRGNADGQLENSCRVIFDFLASLKEGGGGE